MLNIIRSKVVLLRLFISYLLIFVVPLIALTAFLYKISVIDVQKEIVNSNMHKLVQLKDNLDIRMKELEQIAIKMNGDSKLSPGNISKSALTQLEGIDMLGLYKSNNAFTEDMYIYYRDLDIVFSLTGTYSSRAMAKYIYGLDNEEEERMLLEDLNTITMPVIKASQLYYYHKSQNIELLSYYYPISYQIGKPYAVVIFTIKKSILDKMIQDFLGDISGSVFIMDRDKKLLAFTSDIGSTYTDRSLDILNEYGSQGVYSIKYDDRESSLIKVTSDMTGWEFAVTIETSQFYKEAIYMRTLIFQIVVSLLAFGVFIIIIFAQKNYEPIKRVLKNISMLLPQSDKTADMNELDRINNAVTATLKQNKDLKDQIDYQIPLLEDQVLTKILKSEINNEETIGKLMEALNIRLGGPFYTVMLLKKVNEEDGITSGRFKNNLLSLMKDHFGSYGIAYPVELIHSSAIALIVNLPESNGQKDYQEKIINQIKGIVGEHIGEGITIGIGKPYNSLLHINRSFVEAFAIIENNIITGKKNVIFFEDIQESKKLLYWYPAGDQLRFVQSLRQGEKNVALQALQDIGNSIIKKDATIQMLKCVCFDIINMTIKTLNEMNIFEFDSDVEKIMQFTTFEDLLKRLETLTLKICQYVEDKKKCKDADFHNQLLDYINNNYADINLSLESVSDMFGLSTFCISRLFKDITGMTFTDYIARLRMDKSKNLLVHTDKVLRDIIDSVGYSDAASFIRKFKKLEGITPGEYRKIYSENSNCISLNE